MCATQQVPLDGPSLYAWVMYGVGRDSHHIDTSIRAPKAVWLAVNPSPIVASLDELEPNSGPLTVLQPKTPSSLAVVRTNSHNDVPSAWTPNQ